MLLRRQCGRTLGLPRRRRRRDGGNGGALAGAHDSRPRLRRATLRQVAAVAAAADDAANDAAEAAALAAALAAAIREAQLEKVPLRADPWGP